MRYKWATAHEWLFNALENGPHDSNELNSRIRNILSKLDGDTIQDEFQDLMDSDGFFVDLDTWIKTDELQWVKQRGDEMNWQVIDVIVWDDSRYYVKDIGVNLNDYSDVELHSIVTSHYDSLAQIKEQYGENNWHQIVAEIIAENEPPDNQDAQLDSAEELAAHLKEKYGIEADAKDLEV